MLGYGYVSLKAYDLVEFGSYSLINISRGWQAY